MTQLLRLIAAALILIVPPAGTTASATKPVKAKKFVLEESSGYIVVKAGRDRKRGNWLSSCLYLARLDPETGETIWTWGTGRAASRKNSDVAMVVCSGNRWQRIPGNKNVEWYVVPVNPGRWVIAGGGDETSFSLGSYAFEVEPGQLTYIGEILVGKEDGKSDVAAINAMKAPDDILSFGTLYNILMSHSFVLNKPSDTNEMPENLRSYEAVIPDFEAGVTFNNALQGMVSKAADLPD